MNTNLALGFLYSGDIWDEDVPYELHDVGYEMLAELKGKDLVEVVRCKDCKYYKTVYESYKQLPDYYPTEEDKHNGRCNHPDGLDGKLHEDNFCSKGKRKEIKDEIPSNEMQKL